MHKTLLLIVSCYTTVWAQTELSPVGGRSWGMGNAMVAIPQDQFFFHNPAGLAFTEHTFANSSFDTRFDISSLSTVSLAGVFNGKIAKLAVGAQRFGDQQYHQHKIGIALAKKIGLVSFGLKVSLLGYQVEDIQSSNTLLSEFGIITNLNPKISIGFHAHNLTGASLNDFEKIPTTLRLGFAYQAIEKIIIAAETEYIPNQKPYFKAGLEYELFQDFYLRTGLNSGVQTQHFGVGYRYNQWQFDYAVHTHPNLGFSHHFSLQINFPSKGE